MNDDTYAESTNTPPPNALCESENAPAQKPDPQQEQNTACDPATQTDFTALINSLEQVILHGPGDARSILMNQSDILDSLFRALVSANLKDAVIAKFYGKADTATTTAWLGMALKIQKQCTEALKTASTVEYLESISNKLSTPPPEK